MRINLEWLEKQKPESDVAAAIKVGERVLDLMETLPKNTHINPPFLIAAYIALISHGEELHK